MTQQPNPGWYPDPADPTLERYWNGGAWGEARPLGQAKKSRKGWLIAGGVAVVALVGYIGIAALTEKPEPPAPTPVAAPTTDQRADTNTVLAVASNLCGKQIRLRYADPDAKFTLTGWEITATNPAGHPQPSWRVQGVTESRGSTSTPLTFLCDIEYRSSEDSYHASLVG